jgi:hypothetical protein
MIANWFFSLPVMHSLAIVVIVFIVIGTLAVMATDALVNLVVQRRIAGVDEFADRDDQSAELYQPHMTFSGLKLALDKLDVADVDDYYRRVDMKSFTCTNCNQQSYCSFAFDLYNTDGDCLVAK